MLQFTPMIRATFEPGPENIFGVYRIRVEQQPELFLSPVQLQQLDNVIQRLKAGELEVEV